LAVNGGEALLATDAVFFGHPEAGERSAVIYMLLGSCRRQGLNPFDYLKDLFTRLSAAKITDVAQFTPKAWAMSKAGDKTARAG
jgi:hypothetical protein